jgi:hypothetical protein
MTYLNKMGGRRPNLCRLTEEIHGLALQRGIVVSAEWIPGESNVEADHLSRIENDFSEQRLNPALFAEVVRHFGKIEIDLMATSYNKQVTRYVSRGAEEQAWYTDIFSRPLPQGLKMYAFPPFIMVGKLLAKIRREGATVVMVAPVWKAQPWWPLLMEMTVGPYLPLPRTGLFDHRHLPHQLSDPKWRMVVCSVSGGSS